MILFFYYRTFWFSESWSTQTLNLRTGPIYCYYHQEFWTTAPVATIREGSFVLLVYCYYFQVWSFCVDPCNNHYASWVLRWKMCQMCLPNFCGNTGFTHGQKWASSHVYMGHRRICKITVILHTWEMTEPIYSFLKNNAGVFIAS